MKFWIRYLAWFAALKEREKKIVAIAVLVGGLFVGYSFGIEPGLLTARRASKTIDELAVSLPVLQQQTTLLQGVNQDPDAPLRKQLAALKNDFTEQDGRFAKVQNSLVPPEKMAGLLSSFLMKGNALQLVSLRTLAPTPVIARKSPTDAKDKPTSVVGGALESIVDIPGAPNLFKHGVELKLVGSYADLVGYVRDLESAPQRLLWGQMELTTLEYPRSQLSLTVYTLSMDKSWLVL
jgi:MSHA biogenesis protein MshJ